MDIIKKYYKKFTYFEEFITNIMLAAITVLVFISAIARTVKHPLNCIFNDKIKNNGKNVLDSDELIIISKCVNGSYSSKVKRILERSISYVLPFFTVRNKSIHHKVRIDKKLKFKVYYYGDDITEFDRYVADKFVNANANANNLNTEKPKIYFYKDYGDINIWNYL